MGGVGLQQFFICCFFGLAIRFQRQMKQDTPVTEHKRVLQMLYILYTVLTLITVRVTLLIAISNDRTTHIIPGAHHLPPRRIFQRLQQRHPSPRGVPIHPRLNTHAHRARALQHCPSGAHDARQRERLPQPEAAEGYREEKREREGRWRSACLRTFQCPNLRAHSRNRDEPNLS